MQDKIGNKNVIGKELNKNNLKAKKKFGQNFLINQDILNGIVSKSLIDKDTLVIEVGPGLGSLTEHLCENAGYVLAYEIDEELLPILEDNLSRFNNKTIINKDILEVDIEADIKKYQGNLKNVYMVANLPYYITTPIILRTKEKTKMIRRYTLMVQLEVADRICGKPKTKDYNALSIAIGYRALATKVLDVNRKNFMPAPNVDSAVIRLDLYDNPPFTAKNEKHFFKFIRECFTQRRKTLVNNLCSNNYDKDKVKEMLRKLNIKESVRSEELSIEDFVLMSDFLEGEN